MACITKRRGAWVMDARIHGHRIVKVFRTKREAEEALAKHRIEQRQKSRPVVDPFITLRSYAERFVRTARTKRSPNQPSGDTSLSSTATSVRPLARGRSGMSHRPTCVLSYRNERGFRARERDKGDSAGTA